MLFWKYVFFVSCFLIFYNYIGYALLAYIITLLKRSEKETIQQNIPLPSVSFIVAAYNEEDFIEKKIKNSLSLHYPEQLIEYIFITDGSTDSTNNIISRYTTVKLLYLKQRAGKSAALNRVINEAKNDILVFSDANTILNEDAIKNIVRHYTDQNVGGVAGEKKVISISNEGKEIGGNEGAYWRYESFLKKIDSEFYSVVGAAGELFSIRRSLYDPIPMDIILDDFVISLKIAKKGYKIKYEPNAYAIELPSSSIKEEQKRKIRIAAGGFQAINTLGGLLKFWKHPQLTFLYISHRLLRWTISPICLVSIFVSNLIIVLNSDIFFYKVILTLQVAFYLAAILAGLGIMNRSKILKIPYYFVFMNISVIQGFFRYISGKQSAVWEKAGRSKSATNI